MVSVLEVWFTPSGAAVTFSLVVLVILLCAFFSPTAQGLIRQFLDKGVRGKWGSGEIEFGRSLPSKPGDRPPAGEPAPTPPKSIESPELQTSETRPEEADTGDDNSEGALRTRMIIASIQRDHDALETAYQALKTLPNREEPEEILATFKLQLEHRMGDESAADKLARLAEDNSAWYEPYQSLASIYYSLGSYDMASNYLAKAKQRAHDDDQRLRSLLLDARIREKIEGPPASIQFLRASLGDFQEQRDQSKIWERIAELQLSHGDKMSSFVAAEIAIEMRPLEKDLRFQLAYRYAEGQSTKPLAYYHYNKLRNQDYQYPSCLNNMGILFDALDMSASYIATLKRAKEFDQPYPHGNLAIALARAGFLVEAREVIEELPQDRRLETRAAEAADLIRQRESEEAEKMEKLERASELFHKVYFTAALGVQKGEGLDAKSVLGTWTGNLWQLSLEEKSTAETVVGTLKRTGTEYTARLSLASNLLSGEATRKGERVGFFSATTTYKVLLAGKSRGKLTGLIYTDEMDPTEVTLVRQN